MGRDIHDATNRASRDGDSGRIGQVGCVGGDVNFFGEIRREGIGCVGEREMGVGGVGDLLHGHGGWEGGGEDGEVGGWGVGGYVAVEGAEVFFGWWGGGHFGWIWF